MKWAEDLPIRRKLTAGALFISGAALLAALLASFALQLHLARQAAVRDLTVLAEVVAANAAGPLAFNDNAGAVNLLTALRARPEIVAAQLRDASGQVFAHVPLRSGEPVFQPPAPGQSCRVEGLHLYVAQPVVHQGEALGTLEFTADVRGVLGQFAAIAGGAFLLVFGLALLLAFSLAARLQRIITTPLLELAGTARRLAGGSDYTLRTRKHANDEIGELTDAFNHMLAEAHERDSALREAQRQVSQQLTELQREVTERERAEAERRAIERKLEETQRLESLGVLAGGVAHDFNNILTGILGCASLARMEAPRGSETERYLRRIEENSRRAAGLCEQLLTYAGKGRVHSAAVDLNQLVRESLELVHVSVPKDAELSLELAPALPCILGDPARLRQVFMNLMLNAAEALAASPRCIRLATGRRTLDAAGLAALPHPGDARPGEFVFLEVADTGSGMSAETLRRIFEPFYTTKFTGRGLGLCAVLGIMRHHGGALAVASEPGQGTTFRVYFPAAAGAAPVPREAMPAEPARPGVIGAPERVVLVVDDEETVRTSAAIALQRHGFSVRTASDGEQALAAAERCPAPLAGVLLDLTMPRMDGAAALAGLRKLQPQVPVVVMSGLAASDVARQVAGAPGVRRLQKPFTMEELLQVVAEHFAPTGRGNGQAGL
jgi:signal transduction histidine kinase/ActR/RegA family two-component response regulator